MRDVDMLYDALASAIHQVKRAIDEMEGLKALEDLREQLQYTLADMEREMEPLQEELGKEAQADLDYLNRQYERDCI